MTASRSVVYRIQADVSQARAQMAAFGASVRKSADDLTAATKEGAKYRKGLDSLGGAAGKIGLAAAAGLGAAVVSAANFDQAMSKVSAATGESVANMERLRDAALDAGAQTVFSANEAADGIEQLAKAGVSTEAILNGGLKGALDLAAAGSLEVGEAAEVAAKAMTQFSLDGNQVPHIADLLASAAGNASGEVSDFGAALSQSGLIADQVGLSLEETTGGLAAFASAGLLGSDAGTSFKTMLGALTPNSKKAAKQMDELGLSAYDSQGNFIGLAEFAGKLQTSLKDMSAEQRQATMETIFGSDAVRAASVLYEQGEKGISKWIDTVDEQGAAAEMAGRRLDNLKGDLEALGGAFQTELIGIGDSSQGPLRSVTQGLTAMVNDFGRLPDAAHTATAAIMGGSALIGGSVWAGSKMIQGISRTREAMEDLGIDSTKATKAMKGLAAAGAGLAALTVAAVAIRSIQAATDDAVPGVEALTGRLIDLANLPTGFSGSIGAEFNDLGDSIDRMTDKSKMDRFADTMQTPFEGLFGEAGGLRVARADIDALDASLSGLVAAGNADVAADALENLADQYNLSDDQLQRLLSVLPAYGEALEGQANDAKLAGGAQEDLATASEGMAQSMKHSTEITEAQAKALKEARDAARDTASEFVTLGDGLDDAEVSLEKWIKQMADEADALANFTTNAKEAGENGLRKGLIKDLEAAGPAGALRMRQLANATDAEIKRANEAWAKGQKAIRDYIESVTDAKNAGPVVTKVKVLKDAAMADLYRLREFQIGDKTIKIHTVRAGNGGDVDYLSGRGYAEGGYTGAGGKYEPAGVVHRGEYVFDAKATRGNEAYLASLHQTLRGYAGGGLVGASVPSAASIDYERLAQAMSRNRPLYGDVTVVGDGSFRRELQADQQRAGLGGY